MTSSPSASVRVWEEPITIPTYRAPLPDPNPMFFEKRVNQGFHDIFEIDPTVRGGHLYQMDVATEKWHDLSATDPNGSRF